MIDIKNLSFTYNKKSKFAQLALDDITVKIDDGEILGIIGHTGSGKSTFVQHLNALIKPQTGQIEVNGINLSQKKLDYQALRAGIGMVFQYPEYQLFAETVEADVAFALKNFFETKKNKLSKDFISQKVKDALTMVGMDYNEFKERSPFDLSGGQKRRVAIAGTIVAKPSVLILDEPTAGLDPQGKQEIISLLHQLKKSFLKTIIMISHDMNEIAQNCTRVLVLEHGKIKFDLPPEKLFINSEQLTSLNLDIPETVKIAKMLNEKGLNIKESVFNAENLAKEIGKI